MSKIERRQTRFVWHCERCGKEQETDADYYVYPCWFAVEHLPVKVETGGIGDRQRWDYCSAACLNETTFKD